MSAPDFRNDLGAFLEAVYGPEFKSAPHLASIRSLLDSPLNPAHRPRDYTKEPVHFGVDHGKPGGDQTAYTRYSYDGHKIVIEDIDLFDVYETADSDRLYRGRRPSIADLVARIGEKCCDCKAGYLLRLDTLQLVVCPRCDGFSTQHGRRFRARK